MRRSERRTDPSIDRRHARAGFDLDPEIVQLLHGALRQVLGKRREDPRPGFEQMHLGGRRVDGPKVALEREPRELRQRPGHLDSGRPAADDDEAEELRATLQACLALGELEREEYALTDLDRVLD